MGSFDVTRTPRLLDIAASCEHCDEPIQENEEVFLARMYYVVEADNSFEQRLVLHDGEYATEPTYFHFECWEELTEELRELNKDMPAVEHEESVLRCTFCGSGVCCWEHFLRVHIGEVRRSMKAPGGKVWFNFTRVDSGEGSVLCIGCVARVNEDIIDIWGDVSQEGECNSCEYNRCWRAGDCACVCHKEE